MLNARNLIAGAGLAAAVLTAGTSAATAGPEIPLGGYTGPVTLKFFNYESFISTDGACGTNPTISCVGAVPAVGDQNFGIFELTSINAGVNTLWASGISDGTFLVGVFNGITVTGVTNPGLTTERTTNSGGTFQLYQIPVADGFHDLGLAGYTTGGCNDLAGIACYNGITNAAGAQLVLTMSLTPGQGGGGDPLNTTLVALLDGTENPPTGSAASAATITGDPQFGSIAHLQDNFCSNAASPILCSSADGSTFAIASSDPITGTVVPEPASLTLIGTSLVALGALRRRKKMDRRV